MTDNPTSKRYWIRFYSPDSDPRPTIVPAPCQWWCTGVDLDDRSIICADIRCNGEVPWAKLEKWWPKLERDSEELIEDAETWVPGDRFPQKPSSSSLWIEVVL